MPLYANALFVATHVSLRDGHTGFVKAETAVCMSKLFPTHRGSRGVMLHKVGVEFG